MIGRWLLLARGQVRVRVTGASLTRFLNVCARGELTLRRMKRTAWNELYATMSLRDFRALRAYMGRTGCRVHIVRRQGVPFAAARLRPRYALWGGALALLLMCWMLCTRIWSIEWHIDPALPQAELISQLDELGVRIGVRRRAVNARQVRWRMMQKQPRLSFLALNVDGNRMVVEAQAGVPRPELLDGNAVVRVVAAREGVVESVRAAEGQPQVRPGDAVSVGDTLISGLVPPTAEQGACHGG